MTDHPSIQPRDLIEEDLTAFADPNTSVQILEFDRTIFAEWWMRGEKQEAEFSVSPMHGITVKHGRTQGSYADFLAGPRMGNLKNVAKMIRVTSNHGPDTIFVPTRAHRSDVSDAPSLPATDCISQLLSEDTVDSTRVVIVTGEAGSGKTHVLQELVRQKAREYLAGKSASLLLYVNAQGRALARLNEALATELQDLRVSVTYHAVPALVRVGALIPVIDGFDELLGVSGYDDAFSSLTEFLDKLDGEGCVIASARSVYYEAEFLDRARQASVSGRQGWSNVPVKIEAWTHTDRETLLVQKFGNNGLTSAFRSKVDETFAGQEALASKPLFFCKAVDLLHEGADLSRKDNDLLGALASSFLLREQRNKLLDRQGRPLVSDLQLKRLLGELAQEMWTTETRELDQSNVRTVAEVVLSEVDDLSERNRQVVLERMPTLAFLARGTARGRVSFEHEVFFSLFLVGSVLEGGLPGKTNLRALLSHSRISDLVATRFAHEVNRLHSLAGHGRLQEIVDRLNEVAIRDYREVTRINAGVVLVALLREISDQSDTSGTQVTVRIESSIIVGSDLRGLVFEQCVLNDVEMRGADLSDTKFVDCAAQNLRLFLPKISTDGTRLEIRGLANPEHIQGVVHLTENAQLRLYDPEEIGKLCETCGAAVSGGQQRGRVVDSDLSDMLERIMRAYSRSNLLCEDDDRRRRLFSDPNWFILRDLLVAHDIVKAENRRTGGARKKFYRIRVLPEQVMLGTSKMSQVDQRIQRLWEALEAVSGSGRHA